MENFEPLQTIQIVELVIIAGLFAFLGWAAIKMTNDAIEIDNEPKAKKQKG